MTLQEFLSTMNFIIRKSQYGGVLSELEYNTLLKSVTPMFVKKKVNEFEQNKVITARSVFSNKFLKIYREDSTEALSGTPKAFTVPSDYSHSVVMYASSGVSVDVIDDVKYWDIKNDPILSPSDDFPVAVETSTGFNLYPNTLTSVDLVYLKTPVVPYYDYYIDVNGNKVPFEAGGADHVWATGEFDSSGVEHTLGDANYTPLTVEVDFPEEFHYEFMMDLLGNIGLSLKQGEVVQFTELKKQQEAGL